MKKNKNFFKSYLNGEESLGFSFWIVTVLGLTVLSIPNYIILSKGDQVFDTMSDASALFYIIYIIVSFIASIFAFIGLWKSASKYITAKKKNKQSAIWGYLSYTYIILSIIRSINNIIFG
ncbi:hypothetical protein OAL74_05230 [Candidatus Pelagibacter sp.]|jgi:hypothetical protein|nr:hypothetical protein [Candidatus Pelagibacter sp.]